eukprot:9222518-Pyramimonas_sp.AAC.1
MGALFLHWQRPAARVLARLKKRRPAMETLFDPAPQIAGKVAVVIRVAGKREALKVLPQGRNSLGHRRRDAPAPTTPPP